MFCEVMMTECICSECACTTPQIGGSNLSIILSIVAILVSVMAILMEVRGRRTEIETDFFTEYFKDALYKKIPEARKQLSFEGETLYNIQPLMDELAEMRRNADFFRYAEPKFYKKFKSQNQDLEDYLAEGMNKKYDQQRQTEFYEVCDT